VVSAPRTLARAAIGLAVFLPTAACLDIVGLDGDYAEGTSAKPASTTGTSTVGHGGGATTGSGGGGHGGSGPSTTTASGGHGGSTTGTGGHGGASCSPACADPAEPDCEAVTCVDGKCESSFQPKGTKLPDPKQTVGDCEAKVCDGAGKVVEQNDDGDRVVDTNDCVSHTCDQGSPKTDNVALGTKCMSNNGTVCDGKGACVGCNVDADCKDALKPHCDASTCVPAGCSDNVKNGNETDVDCGGGACGKCADGQLCSVPGDCTSNGCCSGTCSACCNGVKDATESDLDCGGSCAQKCDDGKACAGNADCKSALCQNFTCKPSTCSNNTKDGDETDVDCGGSCQPCDQGKVCGKGGDCASSFCTDGVCCNVACGGLCEACVKSRTGLADGACNAVSNGTDPDNECAQDANGAASCKLNGYCDGNRACAKYAANTVCLAASCAAGTQKAASLCDGNGTCNAGASTPCGKYACGAVACNATCATDNDCASGNGCDLGQNPAVCKAKLADGVSCAAGSQCVSGQCTAGKCGLPPSCAGGLDCGGVSCCDAQLVPGGTFPMGRSNGGTDAYAGGYACEQPEHNATVADFRLDTFEITVGRFRKFVSQYNGTPPAAGAGANPNLGGSGWQAAWNSNLPASQVALITNIKCDGIYQTWTDSAGGGHESYPMNCISWFEAFAFCIWDGGRLPTEAEWEYAAAGGSDNRLYPWGSAAPDNAHAVFTCQWDGNSSHCTFADLAPVGSAPAGNGKWGHRDLAGSMWEWNLDWWDQNQNWYSGAGNSCTNCANLNTASYRVIRGSDWSDGAADLRAASRGGDEPSFRSNGIGARCLRTP
jgi:formylglycine-generating enzyme required for sulfatase activity